MDMLECAVAMTRVCERMRSRHFTKRTSNPNTEYIFCCAYTAPTIAISILFLQHYGITRATQLESMLNQHQLLDPNCTPLTPESVCNGINEVMGNIWSHHYEHGTGIDTWIQQHRYNFFDNTLDIGVNLVSFVDTASNSTAHHSMIYVSAVTPEICYIIDSWCSVCYIRRDLAIRQFNTADVVSALRQINTTDNPSQIMIDVFLDPVPGGSCNSRMQVVKLSMAVIQELINTQFRVGCAGVSRFGGGKNKRTHKRNHKRTHKRNHKRNHKRKHVRKQNSKKK